MDKKAKKTIAPKLEELAQARVMSSGDFGVVCSCGRSHGQIRISLI
jgi:hypothetical protein